MGNAKPRIQCESIGRLADEMVTIAERIHARLAHGDILVFAGDDGLVYIDVPDNAGKVPTHWIAGTFRLGEPFEAIIEDLRCLRDSRRRDWMLE
ncbi:hypothetical protein FHW12_003986 [Dokdonella fugitiva]|uniref:Uncharacterized protein n=1 Tax=Dokdonella fugitiva TaxID=328517 RepID=A0A839F7M4_9GAMM|nr:hypothetical protein [Dokdonella fugitiva]MBA8889739.1 hypothetical protein [Dokdonella fugitiva]